MIRKKITKKLSRETISIIVDGDTERWYLQLLKQKENLRHLDIKPELPKKRKLREVFNLVISNATIYDKVVWIVDMDVIIKESQARKKGSKSALVELTEYLERLRKKKNVEVLINNPCLEFWFLLHFKKTSKYYNHCEDVCREFKKTILVDYEKSEKYYKSQVSIYDKLIGLKAIAIDNARSLGEFDPRNPETAKAEIYKVFELLNVRYP